MADWIEVRVSAIGNVTLDVRADKYPQLITGRVWRYLENGNKDGLAGSFSTLRPTIDLGAPQNIANKKFYVAGMVFNHGDNPPTPYEVTIALKQGTNAVVPPTVPQDGGSGNIADDDRAFQYRFIV